VVFATWDTPRDTLRGQISPLGAFRLAPRGGLSQGWSRRQSNGPLLRCSQTVNGGQRVFSPTPDHGGASSHQGSRASGWSSSRASAGRGARVGSSSALGLGGVEVEGLGLGRNGPRTEFVGLVGWLAHRPTQAVAPAWVSNRPGPFAALHRFDEEPVDQAFARESRVGAGQRLAGWKMRKPPVVSRGLSC
jgi:hypothetical protein